MTPALPLPISPWAQFVRGEEESRSRLSSEALPSVLEAASHHPGPLHSRSWALGLGRRDWDGGRWSTEEGLVVSEVGAEKKQKTSLPVCLTYFTSSVCGS